MKKMEMVFSLMITIGVLLIVLALRWADGPMVYLDSVSQCWKTSAAGHLLNCGIIVGVPGLIGLIHAGDQAEEED